MLLQHGVVVAKIADHVEMLAFFALVTISKETFCKEGKASISFT